MIEARCLFRISACLGLGPQFFENYFHTDEKESKEAIKEIQREESRGGGAFFIEGRIKVAFDQV